MTDDREIELEALITEREMMIAENMDCQAKECSMAFVEAHFSDLVKRIRALLTSSTAQA